MVSKELRNVLLNNSEKMKVGAVNREQEPGPGFAFSPDSFP